MKLSIVIAILNSPEIVRRQLLHFGKMDLPDDIEFVFVDDGSTPALSGELKNLRWIYTNDFREWTQPAARNLGVKNATGEQIIVTDIDHIITRGLIERIYNNTEYQFIKFRREVAVLLEDGTFTQDKNELKKWGLLEKYVHRLKIGPHTNSFAADRELYLKHGGVSERLVGTGKYPNREEQTIRARMRNDARKGRIKVLEKTSTNQEMRPVIHMFPNGRFCGERDYNPFGFFHKLSREKWWREKGYRRD